MRTPYIRELVLCLAAVYASANLARAGEPASPKKAPTDVAPEISNDFQDPAFARYVDLALLGQAVAKQDSSMLADAALQLAEGERILLRSHKKLTANSVLQIAVKAAVANRDMATLDRLAKHAKRSGDTKLAAQVSVSRKLAGAARATDPALMLSVADTTVEQFTLYRRLYQEIEASRLVGATDRLEAIEKEMNESDLLNTQQKKYLAKRIDAAKKAVPKKLDGPGKALAKLASQSRQTYVPTYGVRRQVLEIRNNTFRTQTFKVWFIATTPRGKVLGTRYFNVSRTAGPNQKVTLKLSDSLRFQLSPSYASGPRRIWIKVRGTDSDGRVRWWGGSANSLFGINVNGGWGAGPSGVEGWRVNLIL